MKIKELRKINRKTQQQTANELNLQTQTYQNYELGKREPNIEMLCKIADYYNVSLDYLCEHKTKYQQDIGYLNEEQITLLELIKELNEINLVKAIGYVSGLIAGQ